MASQGGPAPPKPWERASTTGPSPFRPSSGANNTAAVVESAGVADSGDINDKSNVRPSSGAISGRQMPPRPWERSNYGGYNSTSNYSQYSGVGANSYGMTPYGSSYGGLYGSNYGNNNYRGGYGLGSTYGGGMYGGGFGMGNSYGGGMYSSPYGGSMYNSGGYGMGMGGPGSLPYGPGDPDNPFGGGPPAGPPSFWQSMLRAMHGVVNFFGRISFLVDQNTQAFHFFITALLQLCDRAGMLYGELARFVLRLLGFRSKPRFHPKAPGLPLPNDEKPANFFIEDSKEGGRAWDNLWSEDTKKVG